MTGKIMELADDYAHNYYFTPVEDAENSERATLAAAIKEEQDYTRAVISERDALKENFEAQQEYTRVAVQELCHLEKERDALHSERDELKALMHKALDERDHFIGERDKLTMVHAERTVERDRLREVAQQALDVYDENFDGPGFRKSLGALRKELGE